MNKFLHNANEYTVHRPQYPAALFQYLANLVADKNLLLDCGSGSGQAAQDLSQYFKKVIATDLSYDLLMSSPKKNNILYVNAKAEMLPVQNQSVDMITIAQALHWFSLNEFYVEVSRVLKLNGIIAAWVYNQSIIEPTIDLLIQKIYQLITSKENISKERQYVYDHYQTIPFPFKKIATPKFEMIVEWNFLELYGYIATWPGLLEYEKKFKANALLNLKDEFIAAWGNIETKKIIRWPIYLLVGQI